MKLKTITFTGIDDRTDIKALQRIQHYFPIVEFGVLMSRNWDKNGNRFMRPSRIRYLEGKGLRLSAHLCGQIAIDAARNHWYGPTWITQGGFSKIFRRCQLNIANADPNMHTFTDGMLPVEELIVQANSTSNEDLRLWKSIRGGKLVDEVTVLIDPSGGKGLQRETDILRSPHKVGYAGGINAGNIREKIMELESDRRVSDYWLDMESGVRTDDWFDVDKVTEVLDEYLKTKAEIEAQNMVTKCIVCEKEFRTNQDEKICPECHVNIEFEKEMQRMISRTRREIFTK